MEGIEEHEFVYGEGKKTYYIASGPQYGPLMIFCHGWPAIAKTWMPQLTAFAVLGFRVVAPDMPGYGRSSVTQKVEDYSLETVNQSMLALLEHLGRDNAIWVGHDWGAVAVWSFVAHYPEKTVGAVGLARPYRSLELGLAHCIGTVNRTVYPAEQYPNGQYDYQVYMERSHGAAAACFERDPAALLRAAYRRGDPAEFGKPSAATASVTADGGWFGGADAPPPQLRAIPASQLCVDEALLEDMARAFRANGFAAPNAWYANHERNRAYSLRDGDGARNDGYLHFPVLFVGARYDPISDVALSTIADEQRVRCTRLTEAVVDAGHWVALERPDEVNRLIAAWLKDSVGYFRGCVGR